MTCLLLNCVCWHGPSLQLPALVPQRLGPPGTAAHEACSICVLTGPNVKLNASWKHALHDYCVRKICQHNMSANSQSPA